MKMFKSVCILLSLIFFLGLSASCSSDKPDSIEPEYGVEIVMEGEGGTSGSINLTQSFIQMGDQKIFEGNTQFQTGDSDSLEINYNFIKTSPDGDTWLIEIKYKDDSLKKEFNFTGEQLIIYENDGLTVLLDNAEKL
jgi:hypothetical protein